MQDLAESKKCSMLSIITINQIGGKSLIIVRSEINQILDKQYKNELRITMLLMG
ncbi:MAG: hypothetical protein WA667_29415 [Candidatus Nitrosopolaris sp.]